MSQYGQTSIAATQQQRLIPTQVSTPECKKAYNSPHLRAKLWNRQICAGGQPNQDICVGKSGAPLMYQNGSVYEAVGLVNFGAKPCERSSVPGVYAKVFSYLDWINNIVSENQ